MWRPGQKAIGYLVESGPCGIVREQSTFTCAHCQQVVTVKPFCDAADAGGMCKSCMGLICSYCVDNGVCDPIEKKIERVERAARDQGDRGRFHREVEAAFSRMR